MALGEFLSHHIEKEHFGIRRSLRRVASDYVAPAYRVVARNVRQHEKSALKVTLLPPRILSATLEGLMAYQLLHGGIDPSVVSLWSLNKAVGWSIPLTCAVVPETLSRRFIKKVVQNMAWAFWQPQEALPVLTYAGVKKLEDVSEQIKNTAYQAWENPGVLVDDAMESLADGVVTTAKVGLKVAEYSTLFAVRTGYRAAEKSANIAVKVAQKSGDEFTSGVRRIVEGVAPMHLNYSPVYLEIPQDGFDI